MESKLKFVHSLHRGRSTKSLVDVVPDNGTGLYRIAWPDIGLSPPANLSRCKDAASEWAELQAIKARDRKRSGARVLKSLDNFLWSRSPVRENGVAFIRHDSCAEKCERPFYTAEVAA
jgi:hypothetical protein